VSCGGLPQSECCVDSKDGWDGWDPLQKIIYTLLKLPEKLDNYKKQQMKIEMKSI